MRMSAAAAMLLLLAACSTSTATVATPSSASPSIAASGSTTLRLVAVDWANSRAVDVPLIASGTQSPDGSRILSGGRVLMMGGKLEGTVSAPTKASWVWADDSRHLCSVYGTPTALYETLPGSYPAMIAQVGYQADQAGPFVLGCSFGHGTATVGESCVINLCETWTVDLLSHRVLSHLSNFRTGATSNPEGHLSQDGTLLAASDYGAALSSLYSTADGSLIGTLTGSRVIAFTADDKAVLVTHAKGPVQLLDLKGAVIATLPGSQVQSTVVEPGGSRIAVALGSPGATASGYPGPADIVLVGFSGQVKTIARGVSPQF